MTQDKIFKIQFNWNRNFFYDGYIILRENGKIVGYTDDSILAGAVTSQITEVRMQPDDEVIQHIFEVSDVFEKIESEDVTAVRKEYNGENCQVFIDIIKIGQKLSILPNVKIIESRVENVSQKFPREIQQTFKKLYLGGS